ncbi:hypothetical protein H5410_054526 [Solanum commersonii]|uniref:BAH domain-containing protein n=1 Tax=Solanum commersonii TaxID=4109 RepID=A0A9J5WHF2_SOLCO|nr:hypothetical protein H5410_054526 [Solanum commersonii]
MVIRRMDTNSHVFILWEERVVSQGKDHRVVHYYLKDSSGEMILVVVGTERSARHMVFVISEDYLDAFGHTSSINSETKWSAKRDIVERLMFLISKHHKSPPISNIPTSERRRSVVMAGHLADEISNIFLQVNSFAIFTVEEESQHLGYLEDFYENKKGQKKAKVRCFEHFQDIKCALPELDGHPREVLITSHVEVIQANCIDALATVLTPGDYDKYISLVPKNLSSGVYMCYREKKIPVPVGIQLVEPQYKLSIEVGDNLEVLCQDSGLRGCWFRCKVLEVSQKRMKVQYDDIQDCDAPEKLEEWVPSYRVAGSEKLGMRCTGRLTVRPRPLEDSSDYSFEIGAAVDAWWSDGWWEGVVTEIDVCGSGHHQVYFPGENMLLEIQRKNLRTSRDWIDDKWVEVKGKKDIKSFVSSSLTDLSKCRIKEHGNCENKMVPKLVAMKTTNCQFLNNQLRSKTMMLLN